MKPIYIAGWAAPIVAVLKGDKASVHISGNFWLTVNPVSKLDKYPIPKVDDLIVRLRKGKFFTKLDFSQAYQQLPLDEECKQFMVIKHSQKTVPVYETAVRNFICSWNFPASDRKPELFISTYDITGGCSGRETLLYIVTAFLHSFCTKY